MDKFIFVHKNWPPNPWVGYLKSIDFASACEVESKLVVELRAKFEDEVEGEKFQTCWNLFNLPFFMCGGARC
jgi:hypothetical protein